MNINFLPESTSFTRDVLGRYICNTLDEALLSSDPNPRPDANRGARPDARPFDYIVIGGGTFGCALAEHLWYRSTSRSSRILVLEGGPFVFPEHVQNLPVFAIDFGPATSIADLRAVGKYGPDKPQAEVWGLAWHSPQKFPGLAYAVGGRSNYWGGWSPRLLDSELPAAKWPAEVLSDINPNTLPNGAKGYFRQSSDQLGVTATNDFIFGALHNALRDRLRNNVNQINDAMDLNTLPDHPAVLFSSTVPAIEELFKMLGLTPPLPGSPGASVADLLNELKIEAPLAVQGQPGHAGFFPFNKFSAVPLVIKAVREAAGEAPGDDIKKRLMIVPRCHVMRLNVVTDGSTRRVDQVITDQGNIKVDPDSKVIVALGTIESTRLALASFQNKIPQASYDRIGKNLMAHLRSNLDVRIPRASFGVLPAALQASALFVKGQHKFADNTVGHFHLQITASGVGATGTNSEAELFKKIPDMDRFEPHLNATDTHVVVTMRGIGEMEPLNANSFVRLDPETDESGVQRAFVNLSPTAKDLELWEAMDKAADDVARIFANGRLVDLIVRNNIEQLQIDASTLATALPYRIDDPTNPGKKMNNPKRRDGLGTTHHEAGTLRMGDSGSGVTDSNCRFHEVGNVYVAGPAVFPTIGSPNPMLTGIALARRLGDHLMPPAPIAPADVGFQYLFDGTQNQFGQWMMAGGGSFVRFERMLIAQQDGRGIGLLFYEPQKFENFIMRLDFLLPHPRGNNNDNSGVFVRFRDPRLPDPAPDPIDPPNNAAFVAVHTGYEIQIDEEARGDQRFNEADGHFFSRTGAIYKVTAPGTAPGQQNYQNTQRLGAETWHAYEIEVTGEEYVVRLNSQEATRFKRDPSDPKHSLRGRRPSADPDSGFVGLQTHTGAVAFANIRIKTL
jgi:choline dehydrogenase-like flavoprotein